MVMKAVTETVLYIYVSPKMTCKIHQTPKNTEIQSLIVNVLILYFSLAGQYVLVTIVMVNKYRIRDISIAVEVVLDWMFVSPS